MGHRTPVPAELRFWPKVRKTDTCRLWIAGKMTDGHGSFNWNGKRSSAHRYAYELLVGPIPEGLVIDHICHNTGCVNPDHLQAVTPRQNSENRASATKRSSTGYRGVYRCSTIGWNAVVESGGKRYKAGPFRSPEAANLAAIALRNEVMTNNLQDPRAEAA